MVAGCADALELARGIAGRLATRAGATCAFVGGSLTAGLGNSASDIDIYLIGPDVLAGRQRLLAGTTWLDVHALRLTELECALRRVAAADPLADLSDDPVSEADLAIAARLHSAVITSGEQAASRLADLIGRDHLARLMIRRWNAAAFNALEDFSGQDLAADPDTATICARSALLAAGKGIAAAGGDTYDGLKWVHKQLARTAPERFPIAEFRLLIRSDPFGPGQPVLRLLGLVQTAMIATAVLGLHGIRLDRWPSWAPGNGTLHRAAGFYPSSTDEYVKLCKPGCRLVRMRWDVALVWGLCDGASSEEVATLAAGFGAAAPAYAKLTPDRARAIVGRLCALGLLTEGVSAPYGTPVAHQA
ncbi:MAG TPA: hypothetical protein VFQ44_09840 [Streptosporangiaceae bacterium]|nr:hypothetical protein [Streptosporangiaceae bacterium]